MKRNNENRINRVWKLCKTFYLFTTILYFSVRGGLPFEKAVGMHLGTGDYGHLVIDHSAMLLRYFRSFYKYSGQGFEASHKLHRSLYSKATSHDSSGPGQS